MSEWISIKEMKKPKPLSSYDIVGKAVSEYWDKHGYQGDMVAFFYQKYEFDSDKDWRFMSEVVLADGHGNMEFLSDFCEGETCVKNLTLVPLDTVLEHYSDIVIANIQECVKNSLCKLLNTLEQAEETAWRSGKYSELIVLIRAHLVVMYFWDNEEDAIRCIENIYVPEKENSDNG